MLTTRASPTPDHCYSSQSLPYLQIQLTESADAEFGIDEAPQAVEAMSDEPTAILTLAWILKLPWRLARPAEDACCAAWQQGQAHSAARVLLLAMASIGLSHAQQQQQHAQAAESSIWGRQCLASRG